MLVRSSNISIFSYVPGKIVKVYMYKSATPDCRKYITACCLKMIRISKAKSGKIITTVRAAFRQRRKRSSDDTSGSGGESATESSSCLWRRGESEFRSKCHNDERNERRLYPPTTNRPNSFLTYIIIISL